MDRSRCVAIAAAALALALTGCQHQGGADTSHADAVQGVVINGVKLEEFIGKPEPLPNESPAYFRQALTGQRQTVIGQTVAGPTKELQAEGYWCVAHYIAKTGDTTWIDAFAMNQQSGAGGRFPDTSSVSKGCAAMVTGLRNTGAMFE